MNRHLFLDKLRIAATCAVVLLHTVTGVMDTTDMSLYPMEKTVFLVALDLITWCVPLFVLISGYLFLNPAKKISYKQMLAKYCRRILLALFLFGVPYSCLELIAVERTFRVGMLGEAVVMVCTGKTWSHMWYLYMILLLYLVTPALKWILAKIPPAVLYAVMAFFVLGSSILPFVKKLFELEQLVVLPDGSIYFFYYLCGYLFACANERAGSKGGTVDAVRRKIAFAVLVCLFGGMVCSRLFGDYSVQMAYNYPFTVLASLLMMWLAQSRERSKALNEGGKSTVMLGKISALCFTIYLIHPVFLNVFYKFLHITLLDFPIWFSLPGIFLLVSVLSVIVAWVLYQVPMLKKWVL